MGTRCYCGTEHRRELVRTTRAANGIDYVEVGYLHDDPNQPVLEVFFIHDLPGSGSGNPVPADASPLSLSNLHFDGGVRIQGIRVADINPAGSGLKPRSNLLVVVPSMVGDTSTYTFRLIRRPGEPSQPPDGFDPLLSSVDFRFNVKTVSEFDCQPAMVCSQENLLEPQIDYLSKDYDSFRQLMLDRLAVLSPDWKERNPADLQVVMVELLAYVGDQLSYYQDAVATEAYLGTARRRVSVRRHARLLDYPMHDGCNARVWVAFTVDAQADGKILLGPDPSTILEGTILLSKGSASTCVLDPHDPDHPIKTVLADALTGGARIFETMHDLTLYQAHNAIKFYTWGEEKCCLPKDTTKAYLEEASGSGESLHLEAGKVLIFEEQVDPGTGKAEDVDPNHRHAVRLTQVSSAIPDAVTGRNYREVQWDAEDALPFPLWIGTVEDPLHPEHPQQMSIARGNVVLADHGYTCSEDEPMERVPEVGVYRPSLKLGQITQQGWVRKRRYKSGRWQLTDRWVPVDLEAPARAAFDWAMSAVMPAVRLKQADGAGQAQVWTPRHDLLDSDGFACDFVVEVEEDGSARLRFGSGEHGQQPDSTMAFTARYRTGNGMVSNVGAETIAHVVSDLPGILSVRNPLPARGGRDPEPIEQVRLYAPQAFRKQERAVTPADYQALAESHPEVQKALATIRWTGSWHTVFVSIDRLGGRKVDEPFCQEMLEYLEKYRLAGFDLQVTGPEFVPLHLKMDVQIEDGYCQGHVKKALLDVFSNRDLPGGRRGFFHPDNLTFGQPVYLSQIYEAALRVAGVESANVSLSFWTSQGTGIPASDCLHVGRFQIARLDNDPELPEFGKIEINLDGGL